MILSLKSTAVLILSISITGCGSADKDSTSNVKIVNGAPAPAPAAWQPTFSSVVKLTAASGTGYCTGTFIRANVMLTAAHCTALKDGIIGKAVSINGIASSETIVAPGVKDLHNPETNVIYDLAVIKFSRNIAASLGVRSFPQIQLTPPANGGDLMIAGYGRTSKEKNGGTFHWGTNTLEKRSVNFLHITAVLTGAGDGVNAVSEHGDSGGPMFNMQKQIVGTTRAGDWDDDTKHSVYVWLGSDVSRALLKRAGVL